MRIRKVRIHRFGGPDVLRVDQVEQSMPDALQVLVSELAEIVELVAGGKVKPHVHRTFRLEEAARAMAVVEQGGSVGKVVLSLG